MRPEWLPTPSVDIHKNEIVVIDVCMKSVRTYNDPITFSINPGIYYYLEYASVCDKSEFYWWRGSVPWQKKKFL